MPGGPRASVIVLAILASYALGALTVYAPFSSISPASLNNTFFWTSNLTSEAKDISVSIVWIFAAVLVLAVYGEMNLK